MSRQYIKKSEYWNKFSKGNDVGKSSLDEILSEQNSEPSFAGEPFYSNLSKASYKEMAAHPQQT